MTGAQLLVERRPPRPKTPVGIKIDRVGFVMATVQWADGNRLGAAFERIPPAILERIEKL